MIQEIGRQTQNFLSMMPSFLASLLMQSSLSPILQSKTFYIQLFVKKNPGQSYIANRPADGAADGVGGEASGHAAGGLVNGGEIDLGTEETSLKCEGDDKKHL